MEEDQQQWGTLLRSEETKFLMAARESSQSAPSKSVSDVDNHQDISYTTIKRQLSSLSSLSGGDHESYLETQPLQSKEPPIASKITPLMLEKHNKLLNRLSKK